MAISINSFKPQMQLLAFPPRATTHRPISLKIPFNLNRPTSLCSAKPYKWRPVKSCLPNQDIDMVKTKDGVYAANAKKVVILWDLDNKPPRGPPYEAARALKSMAQKFGDVIDMSAYANRHAFIHLPQWVVQDRREQRRHDARERRGLETPLEPYICSVCGRKCKTNMDLKKHFRQLHEREREKKMSRMRSLKGKKRQRFKERHITGNEKYNEAARRLVTPKVGYGLAQELRRAGVYVKTVQDKPQAADWALKKQMLHSMTRGVDWIVLVSDDSDFSDMLRKAREANMGTVVVGDQDRSLGRHADVWVQWNRVENGEIRESDLELRKREWKDSDDERGERFSVSEFDSNLGSVSVEQGLDEILEAIQFNGARISSFSEGEEEDEGWSKSRVDRRVKVDAQFGGDYEDEDDDDDDDDDDGEYDDDYLLDSEDEGENDVYL